jgi:ribosomal protein S18 acetylase RimI-like enzyme
MNNAPNIRLAAPADQDAIWTILQPIFRAGDTYTIDPGISSEGALAYWSAATSHVYVAEVGGQMLGTFYIKRNQAGGGAHVCNCGFATSNAAQGKGIARHMLDHALAEAARLGFEAMQFNFVVSTNTRAIAIWKRAGFQTVGRLPGAFIHPRHGKTDALVMWKDLEPIDTKQL